MIIRADFWIYIFLIFGVSHITSFAQAQPYQEAKLVRKVFEIYQPKSFTMQREYCGYLYEDNRGKLLVGPVAAGTYASCTLDVPQYGEIVASWHTHGSADATGIAEIPSFQDIQTDIQNKTRGYIATPGGRLWYIDFISQTAQQLCGVGCLDKDPNFKNDSEVTIQKSYTRNELYRLFGN